MKRIVKVAILSMLFTILLYVNAFAETKEVKLNVDKDYTNAIFYITWDNVEEKGSVELISPDGKVYSKEKTSDNVYEANGEAIVNVGQPAKGEWTIKVSGDNLGVVKVEAGQLPNSMVIDSFSVEAKDDKYIAKYSISDCPEQVQIEVFADTDNEGFDGEKVYSGTGGPSGEAELSFGNLKPCEYHFYIRVSKDGVFKRAYTDSVISISRKDSQKKVKDVKGGKYNDGYYISWTNENENDRKTVYVWDKDMNLISEVETEAGDTLYYGDFKDSDEKVYLAVVDGNDCNYDKIEVNRDTTVDANVVYDVEENVTNHKFIIADVTINGKAVIDAWLNDELMLEGETESGKYRINMSDGDNVVVFRITDEKNNVITFTKNIYVDTVPPALSIADDIDNSITSKDYIYISGYSEEGAVLTLNGREIEMEKGYFNEKVSLKLGKNAIKLVATDIAGNESQYSATVTYEMSKSSRRELYIIAGVIIILVVVYMIVFIKGIKRRKKK